MKALVTVAALAAACMLAAPAAAHRLEHHPWPHAELAKLKAKARWLPHQIRHDDATRWHERRLLKGFYRSARDHFDVTRTNRYLWHSHKYLRHLRWFHRDRKAIKWVQRKIAHLQEASGWNSSDLALIPGVPYSFAACVALRESTNGTASSDVYGILPVNTWANAPLAAQKHQFAHLYALYGVSPWAPYDGCTG